MAATRFLVLLLLAFAMAPGRAAPVECPDGCEVPAASLAPAPLASPDSPSLLPFVESVGLCLVAAGGVAGGIFLARRA